MKSTPFLAGTYKRIAKMSVQVINGSNGEPIGHHMPLNVPRFQRVQTEALARTGS
jgi:hypothetical protein